MAGGALIIEHGAFPLPATWEPGAGLPICRSDWRSLLPEQLPLREERLLVANAVPRSDEAVHFFYWLRDHPLPVPTLAILPGEDSELLQIAAEGVDDFLLHPVHGGELQRRIARLLGRQPRSSEDVRECLIGELSLRQIVGKAPVFRRVLAQAGLFASSDAPVLLTGETGTGKELCARLVHAMSKRRDGPFIPVDCGGIPEHLFESELFGHMRGAFTDAHLEQRGLVALAEGGTLFLDEVDSLSPTVQGKILRLLQERTYRPLGCTSFQSANLRVVAATNRNLEGLVRDRLFREDLYFRLNVLRLHMPPLRQRPEDIALLARHFIEEICASGGGPKKVFSPASMRKLEAHDWPGNVRELANTIQRAIFAAEGTQIASAHIDFSLFDTKVEGPAQTFRSAKMVAIEKFEREYVEQLLEKHVGNITRAALEAGKDRRAFGRLVKKHRISPTTGGSSPSGAGSF
ncbi:MAG TPA: sigma-54 dependent transcriptional regulator [Terracidiphilus sp.]